MKKLVIDNKDLLLDWDWVKNNEIGLDPNFLTCGSNKLAHWKCHVCGNEWTTRIERKNSGAKCKKCIAQGYTIAPREKSLAVNFPEIAKEWDYELNETTPDKVYPQSNKKYHWICSKGHRWENTACHRTIRKESCPFCSNRKVQRGSNDLATTHPQILDEWDYEKNDKAGLFPFNFTYGSKQVVNWKCKRGHSYKCEIYRKTGNITNCPFCRRELKVSFPEKAFAFYFSKLFKDCIENYQIPDFKKRELDIFIPSINVGIEYDGSKWHKNVEKDLRKDIFCSDKNILLYRIREDGCPDYDSDSIKIKINPKSDKQLEATIKKVIDDINKRFSLSLFVDINIDRDSERIMSKVLSQIKENSIANSDLIKEWDWELNKGIDPALVPIFSNKKYWWRCSNNHSWKTKCSKRSSGSKCPYCAGQKVFEGFNDLASKYPNIAIEWDYEKNKEKPNEVSSRSNKSYWWICSKCGYNWKTRIYVRTGFGCGCPECKKKKLSQINCSRIINLDTNVIYNSIKEASEKTNINAGAISNCCRGITKTAGKQHWAYLGK